MAVRYPIPGVVHADSLCPGLLCWLEGDEHDLNTEVLRGGNAFADVLIPGEEVRALYHTCPSEGGQITVDETVIHWHVQRQTAKRWGDLYRGRGAVERTFGRLKHEYGLKPLRVRGIERVALHADLCILTMLATALSRARAVPLAA